MDYDLYHDESKEAGYWHGILLVPRDTRHKLLDGLKQIRTNTGSSGVMCLKGLERTWVRGTVALVHGCISVLPRCSRI